MREDSLTLGRQKCNSLHCFIFLFRTAIFIVWAITFLNIWQVTVSDYSMLHTHNSAQNVINTSCPLWALTCQKG